MARSNTYFIGYAQSLSDFLASMKAGAEQCECGPVEIDLIKHAAQQLWDGVKGIIDTTNA